MVFTVLAALSGMEREYIRDRTLEGHESARARGKSIGGAAVTDEAMLAVALHLRGQELSLRDIAARQRPWSPIIICLARCGPGAVGEGGFPVRSPWVGR